MNKIFVFRGPAASGKGTIVSAFLPHIRGKVVLLEHDLFRWDLHLHNRRIADVTDAEHDLAYQNLLAVLDNYLASGWYTLVTEGLFSWSKTGPHGNMQDILHRAEKHGYVAIPVLLYSDREILWQRNLARDYAVPSAEFDLLYDYVMEEQGEGEIKIDVGTTNIEEAVEVLRSYL